MTFREEWNGLLKALGPGPSRRGSATATALALTAGGAPAQDLRKITFVQPGPSAINSFPVFVAIGEGFSRTRG